jgi:oxygen-independent coproporphyrinogen III oxidase
MPAKPKPPETPDLQAATGGRGRSLGLYLHVPFCRTKCGYCDFYSVPTVEQPTLPIVQVLVTELEDRLAARTSPITTIFVGGGTPTILPPEELATVLSPIREAVLSDHPAEFTVEANPGTLTDATLQVLTAAGVDRVSMGAQSFHAADLQALERIHEPADVERGVETCRRHGIRRINLDLIFGVPGQTLRRWRDSLRRAIDLGVEHLACYGLTYEPGTPLTAARERGAVEPCADDLESEMYLAAIADLQAAGYAQYEISNFAQPGERCLHNLLYWHNLPYIGVGPSAAGYLGGVRYKNVSDLAEYARRMDRDGHAVEESEQLSGAALAGETAMLNLRLNEGLVFADFLARTGCDARTLFASAIATHAAKGWLAVSASGIALTPAGRLMANTVIADFLADPEA